MSGHASIAERLRAGPVARQIRAERLVVVLRRVEPQDRLLALVRELADAGARIFEVTFDAPSAADDLRTLQGHLSQRQDGPFLLGAGTLLDAQQLRAAREAGAKFGVSPLLDRAVVEEALRVDLPFVPGGMTPTEVAAGWQVGATFVKLFPASAVGPSFVRELRGPLPGVELIPTGGIDGANASAFLEAGAAAVGIGSALLKAAAATRRELVSNLRAAR